MLIYFRGEVLQKKNIFIKIQWFKSKEYGFKKEPIYVCMYRVFKKEGIKVNAY